MPRTASFSGTDDEDEPLLFGKATLGSLLHPDIEERSKENTVVIPDDVEIKADWWRWLVLLSFCFSAWVNSILWITFAPVAIATEQFYSITPFAVNGNVRS